MLSQGQIEWQGFGIERFRQIIHVEIVFPETSNVLAHVGAGRGGKFGRDGMSVGSHGGKHLGQVGDVGEHDPVGDQAGVFELLLLLDRIAAFDDRASEGDPIEKIVEGFDLCGFGADGPADLRIGNVTQRKELPLDPARIERTICIMSCQCVAISRQLISLVNSITVIRSLKWESSLF